MRSGVIDQSLLSSDSCSCLWAVASGGSRSFASAVTTEQRAPEGRLEYGGASCVGTPAGAGAGMSRKTSCNLM